MCQANESSNTLFLNLSKCSFERQTSFEIADGLTQLKREADVPSASFGFWQ